MKILIANDGSKCADAALDDLQDAGLPDNADVLVISAEEIKSQLPQLTALVASGGYYFPDDPRVEAIHERQLTEARTIAAAAAETLRARFPTWHIETVAAECAPESAIVQQAGEWKPDLVVVGSHGWSGFRRFWLGSVSQHVLNHTRCSVRICRPHSCRGDRAVRLIVGFDGSVGSAAAMQAVMARHWPSHTEIRVVGVMDSASVLTTPLSLTPEAVPLAMEEKWRDQLSATAQEAVSKLQTSGLEAMQRVLDGPPGQVLISEAETWNADCLFVGARGVNTLTRILLGSVSATVAQKAHCSVEVVRRPFPYQENT